MELSKTLLKLFNILFPFGDFFYILQSDEYLTNRYIRWLPEFFFRRNFQVRGKLQYTLRVKQMMIVTLVLWSISLALTLYTTRYIPYFVIATFALHCVLIPFFVLIGNYVTTPFYNRIKSKFRSAAHHLIESNKKLKVIAVGGSFGKTTVKNFIQQLIQFNYRTQMIPGNINTPAGIAVWIANNLKLSTEVLIMEVDSYEIGEIARSCDIAPADIAILTNVGDQHLERHGNKEHLAIALAETFTHAKKEAVLICNKETQAAIAPHTKERQITLVSENDGIEYKGSALQVPPQLSQSNIINIKLALAVAEVLDIPLRFVEDSLKKLVLPDRRQKPTTMYGYEAIDDSYNISFTTAQAGIAAAKAEASRRNKKLLVITAGIPELAKDQADKNMALGRILSEQADHTIILNSQFSKEIQRGFSSKKNFTVLPSLQQFLASTKASFSPEEWYLLVQPELNDLYY